MVFAIMQVPAQHQSGMPENPPLVSVIVPAFDAEATLAETLCSVSAQTHSRLEILVVDDGSTDGTGALAERIGRSEPRLSLIRQATAGVAAARGVTMSRGWIRMTRGIRSSLPDNLAFLRRRKALWVLSTPAIG